MPQQSERTRLFQAVARVEVSTHLGEQRGTAFLVAAQHALTALHVVADRHADSPVALGPVRLHFPSQTIAAELVAFDRQADWALLRLIEVPQDVAGQPIAPLLLLPLSEDDLSPGPLSWLSVGFP